MKLVLATGNPGKLRELRDLLTPHAIELVSQADFGTPDAVEDGLSFIENAIIKARNASQYANLPALADDSGLEVDALMGAPGIYSARYAGPACDDAANNAKLLDALASIPDAERSARFRCVMAFVRHAADPSPIICEGSWEGTILHQPQGDNGFGYDPLFRVGGESSSSAELSPEQKNAVSHRGQAVRAMVLRLAELNHRAQ